MTDTERLDFLERVCSTEADHAPAIRGSAAKGWVIWDQWNGLTMMGKGATLRDALDDAIQNTPERA